MNLLNSPILDIALTLAFVYSMLALVVSTINEVIMSMLKKRQKLLEIAINDLLFDDEWKKISQDLIDSPFIKSLKRRSARLPAYIPSRSFAQAMLDVLRNKQDIQLTAATIRSELISSSSPIKGEAKQMLLGLLDQAENDLPRFQSALEKFYDDAMDRVNGWYKKYVRVWIFCISLVLCIMMNVDTLLITRSLWQDPANAKLVAGMINEEMKNIKVDSTSNYTIQTVSGNDTVKMASLNNTGNDTSVTDGTKLNIRKNVQSINQTNAIIQSLPLPIGWDETNKPKDCKEWIFKIFGLVFTAFALMLGAPFWFDLLNKIVNLRAVGKKPLKSDEDPNLTNK